jgi:hypothetical protein
LIFGKNTEDILQHRPECKKTHSMGATAGLRARIAADKRKDRTPEIVE